MSLSRRPNPLIGFLYLLLLGGSVAALVVFNELAWFFLLLLLLLLVLLLWWLLFGKLEPPKYPPEEFFIQDEVIVRGPREEVEQAIGRVSGVTLTEIDRIDFGEFPDYLRNCLMDCSRLDYNSLIVVLLKIEGKEQDVATAIRLINNEVGHGSDVRPEPNWLAGRPYDPTGTGADPWDPTGSGADPWDPTGSGADPWDPTGSGEKKQLKPANPDLFMKQWAFSHIGLIDRADDFRGRRVRIGIFDTWPLKKDDNNLLAWITEPSPLTPDVKDGYRMLSPEAKDYDLSSHGLFTAGLTHAVAPEANIQLYHVLNENNKGAIFSLMKAIFDFILDYSRNQSSGNSDEIGAVINMSLGIRVPPAAANFNLPAEGQALRDLLLVARCADIVVVAASGNNSAKALLPEPANVPANWSDVIGVASSNFDRVMACFSNQGNIAAPGGDGVPSRYNPEGCIGATSQCNQDEDCRNAVIGPVLKTDDNTGFAFWNGTSFSSPLVAGLAACIIELGQGNMSVDQVRQCMEDGATDPGPYIGAGIINIPETIQRCASSPDRSNGNDQKPNDPVPHDPGAGKLDQDKSGMDDPDQATHHYDKGQSAK